MWRKYQMFNVDRDTGYKHPLSFLMSETSCVLCLVHQQCVYTRIAFHCNSSHNVSDVATIVLVYHDLNMRFDKTDKIRTLLIKIRVIRLGVELHVY